VTESTPAVSIVVPVFNPGPYLAPLLASLLAQTEPSLEIIAVDDGSSDDSAEILRRAASNDPRLTVLSQSNAGISAARNLGIDHARGRWLAFADSDDWLDPCALATWRAFGESADLEVVYGNGFRFAGGAAEPVVATSDLIVRYKTPGDGLSGADWMTGCIARGQWSTFAWLQFVRRDVLERGRLRFDEGLVHEDVLWSLRLSLLARRIGFLAEPLYGYRRHPAALTANRTIDMLHQRARSYLDIMRHFLAAADQHFHERALRRALLRHAQREGRNFYALMRKGVLSERMRRELAAEFRRLGLQRAMYLGADSLQTASRAVRCWIRLRACVAT
jgi:glycosyltransferase involved in cell wall biosynthesis